MFLPSLFIFLVVFIVGKDCQSHDAIKQQSMLMDSSIPQSNSTEDAVTRAMMPAVRAVLKRLLESVKEKRVRIISECLSKEFSFQSCKSVYNKKQYIKLLSFFPKGVEISLDILRMTGYVDTDFIEIEALATTIFADGPSAQAIVVIHVAKKTLLLSKVITIDCGRKP